MIACYTLALPMKERLIDGIVFRIPIDDYMCEVFLIVFRRLHYLKCSKQPADLF